MIIYRRFGENMKFGEFRKLCEERKQLETMKANKNIYNQKRLDKIIEILQNKNFENEFKDFFEVSLAVFEKSMIKFFMDKYPDKTVSIIENKSDDSILDTIDIKIDKKIYKNISCTNKNAPKVFISELIYTKNKILIWEELIKDYPDITEASWEAVRNEMYEYEYKQIDQINKNIEENLNQRAFLQNKRLIEEKIKQLSNEAIKLEKEKKSLIEKTFTFNED